MNNQIKDCFIKAYGYVPLPVEENIPIEIEKFAELIVQECVTVLERHHPFTEDPKAYLYAISLIEEHFGVE